MSETKPPNKSKQKKDTRGQFGPYAIIPMALWKECSHVQLCTYGAISYMEGQNSYTWASVEKIAECSGYSVSATKKAIRDLVKLGWVGRIKQFGRSSKLFVYRDIVTNESIRQNTIAAKRQANKEFSDKMRALKEEKKHLSKGQNLSSNEGQNLSPTFGQNLSPSKRQNLSPFIEDNQFKNNIEDNQCVGNIAKLSQDSPSISHTDIALGFKTTRQVKETIYRKLSERGIPFTPGSDEAAIEKHKTDSPDEFIFKINRLEKLHYIKTNWIRFKDKLPKTHLQACEKLAIQSPTIPWALGNYSTEVDGVFDLVKSLVEEEVRITEIRAQNRQRADLEKEAYLEQQEERLRELSWEEKEASRKKIEEFNRRWQARQSETTEQPSQPAVQVPDTIREQIDRITRQAEGRTLTEEEREVLKRLFQMGREQI